MRALRVAAALCVVLLAAGAEAGAALNKSPSTDASLLRESLLASSKATKRAKEAARAVRANGADGLFDGIFADARQHLTPGKRSADATDDADAAEDADGAGEKAARDARSARVSGVFFPGPGVQELSVARAR